MELQDLRRELNTVNAELTDLFVKRMEITRRVAAYKMARGLPVLDRVREQQILADVGARAGEHGAGAKSLFRRILALSRADQTECLLTREGMALPSLSRIPAEVAFPEEGTICFCGGPGGDGQTACAAILPKGEYVPVNSLSELYDAIANGKCRFGLVGADGASGDFVFDVYAGLAAQGLYIVREISVRAERALLVMPGADESALREIWIEPADAARYIKRLDFPNARFVYCADSAIAAEQASARSCASVGVFAPVRCGERYGLRPLTTTAVSLHRFLCVSGEPDCFAGSDRVGLLLEYSGEPRELLAELSDRGVVVVGLQKETGSGRLMLELAIPPRAAETASLLSTLKYACARFVFLGGYEAI